jgi:hypothetical protein
MTGNVVSWRIGDVRYGIYTPFRLAMQWVSRGFLQKVGPLPVVRRGIVWAISVISMAAAHNDRDSMQGLRPRPTDY